MRQSTFILAVFALVLACVSSENTYDTKYFEVPVDHFTYTKNETFKMKYLVNESYWNKENGPILFFTGSEGQIEIFAVVAGFVWELAKELNAKLVFAEHRYYGSSLPFGNKSLENNNIGYLSTAQVLADYADLVDFLQGHAVKPKYPVIAIGGSYGGMLSAYFRMKYPHMVNGAISGTSMLHMFPGMIPCDSFSRMVTTAFNFTSQGLCSDSRGRVNTCEGCVHNIRRSWQVIRKLVSARQSEYLKTELNLCTPVKSAKDLEDLFDFLRNMYEVLAMVNYPYPSYDYLVPLPAYPVRTACQYLNNSAINDTALLKGLGKVLNMYTNYHNQSKCVSYVKPRKQCTPPSAWAYQGCTEMVMPSCSNGVTDMFEPKAWNLTEVSEDCRVQYGVVPLVNEARVEYGGNLLHAASNIVFSNALLDPYVVGGILQGCGSVETVTIPDGAHYVDMMASHPNDPDSVIYARSFHKQRIQRWIGEFRCRQ